MVAGISADSLVGSLAGATTAMGKEGAVKPSARPAGVMVTVHGTSFDPKPVIEIMRECRSKLFELADGEWRDGKWIDFDPMRSARNVVVLEGNPSYPMSRSREHQPSGRVTSAPHVEGLHCGAQPHDNEAAMACRELRTRARALVAFRLTELRSLFRPLNAS